MYDRFSMYLLVIRIHIWHIIFSNTPIHVSVRVSHYNPIKRHNPKLRAVGLPVSDLPVRCGYLL